MSKHNPLWREALIDALGEVEQLEQQIGRELENV